MRKEAFMRDRFTIRLRLLAGGVALAMTISFGMWSAPPAEAAATRSHHHERPAKPDAIPGKGLLCDFDHTSWCVGGAKASPASTIELYAALLYIIDFIIKVIVGDRPADDGEDDGDYKGKHRRNEDEGLCLSQAGGDVIWAKCGTKSGTAIYNSATWVVVVANNGGFGFANLYWLEKGETLYLTEPPKITAGAHLRLHHLFGGAGGQALQEWKFFSLRANGQLTNEVLKPGEIVRL
jgi:hypothetical protein